jgi:transcriptional regulator with XRE-family HTH domain
MEAESPTPSMPVLLKAVREAKGWKASRLADKIGVSETTFSRWENGHQLPSRRHQRRLCEVLDVEPSELGFEGDLFEVERRRFIKRLLQVVAIGTAVPLLDPEYEDPLERLALAIRRPSHLDVQTVEHLEEITHGHRELYHRLGPFELLGEINGHLRTLVLLLTDAKSMKLRRRVASMAGETAGHAAWLSFDIQHRRAVGRYYKIADAAMQQAGDPALLAYIRGFRSTVRRSEGVPKGALLLAQGANDLAAKSATSTTSSWLKGLEAQALATIGNAKDCFTALKRSESALERSRPEEDPAWMYRFDRGRFEVLAGSCYRRLGKAKAAERTLEAALVSLGPSCSARRRSEVLLELAYVEVQRRDIERACTFASQSLAGVLQVGSVAGVQDVRQFRTHLDPWRDSRAVAGLEERLAAIL